MSGNASKARDRGKDRGRGKGNILLVEREAELRAFISGILTDAGYVVFESADGYQAFLLSESLTQPLHLLLAEVDLGAEIGGVELSRHLQVLRPGLKVLFLSTVPANPELRRELQAMLDSYLSKPFTEAALLAKVDRMMEKGRAGGNAARGGSLTRMEQRVAVIKADWKPAGEPAA
jgi:DNA-binding response OmpR family regulator